MEVPLMEVNPPPGTDEFMLSPGARRSTNEDESEKEDMVSCFVVEPTVIALDMQAGAPTALVKPSLPEEMTVAMPAALKLSIIALRGSASQLVVFMPPPRLMFTAAKVRVPLRA